MNSSRINRSRPVNLLKKFDSILDIEKPMPASELMTARTTRNRLMVRKAILFSEFKESPIPRMKSTESTDYSDDDEDFANSMDVDQEEGCCELMTAKTTRNRLMVRKAILVSEFEESPVPRMKSTESTFYSDDDEKLSDLMDFDQEEDFVPSGLDKLMNAIIVHTPSTKDTRKLSQSPISKDSHGIVSVKRHNSNSGLGKSKRRCLNDFDLQSFEAEAEIKSSLSVDNELTGDFSRSHCLPIVLGKHPDLRSISPQTLSDVFKNKYRDTVEEFLIVDCRYPYEYDGGHLPGAENLYTHEKVQELLEKPRIAKCPSKRFVIIFHCEFSSERGPKMARYLRSQDRLKNADNYPQLCYPEMYLLDGGYKNFYEQCPDFHLTYKPMLHMDHADDLRHFRAKTKSSKTGKHTRIVHDKTRVGLVF